MDDTALAAPELGADGTDQGFIKWFKALPQVCRLIYTPDIALAIVITCSHAMCCILQEPNLMRFFDRKVSFTFCRVYINDVLSQTCSLRLWI